MAKVDNIIFCLRTTNSEEQGVSANTVLSAITPEYIPGLFSFSVIVCLLDLDYNAEHFFSVEFVDPTGEKVVNIENQVMPRLQLYEGNVPNEYKGINIAMEWNNVNLKVSGLYTIRFLYDGLEIGTKKIYVKGKNEE